ncbi:hypothetical protein K2173_027831 [Erythroxylum novogranatense]|uniref:ARC6 IMS domain-containing protein n=1 Tax=Erythroxylum novogranatense TaxID=1862640 RepID=A0AAV8U321_9ROSI|nr:hypothetical protein K2173_027831 [Erythroxylum novogranatense]
METIRHLAIGICSPTPFAPSLQPPRKPSKLTKTAAFPASRWAERLISDFQFLTTTSDVSSDHHNSLSSSTATLAPPPPPPPLAPPERHISIPLHFYKMLEAETHFLGDGIKRAYEARVSKPPQYGFSQEALISRRQILQAACETLADPEWRRDYNQGLIEDEEDTIITQVPWEKVPGALCVLQEAGDSETVLKIGAGLLRERLPKSFKQDVILAMALAYVDISRDAMVLSPPDFFRGCEALSRALKLLQEEGASNLAPDLKAQIDETLEEINPRCFLDLLALPLDDEFRVKREEGLLGMRNILWAVGGGGAAPVAGGFTREDFMNEAFLRMTAAEQVDLFVATPNNIPAESFEVYGVALALVAQAFIGKKPHLITDADNLFQQLQQTKVPAQGTIAYIPIENREIDFALERGLCSLLLGEVDDCRSWLGLDSDHSPYRNPSIIDFIMENLRDDYENDLPGLCRLLETWLMEVVFLRFRDTKDVQFKLGDYYDDPTVLRHLERREGAGHSPLEAAAAIVRIGSDAVIDRVKTSAIHALQKVFPPGQKAEGVGSKEAGVNYSLTVMASEQPVEQLDQENIAIAHDDSGKNMEDVRKVELITDKIKQEIVMIMSAGVAIGVITLVGLRFLPSTNGLFNRKKEIDSTMTSDIVHAENYAGEFVDPKSTEELTRMDARLAEDIVRKWQDIKAQAFGPGHCTEKLPEVLDGQMLKIWTDRAAEITQLGWVYNYDLLELTIDSVTVSLDGQHAHVEATLKEAAYLTDAVNPENNASNITTYTMRYEISSSKTGWKITEGAIIL